MFLRRKHWLFWYLQPASFGTGIYIISSPGSWAFRVSLELYLGFPGSPARRQQIWGLSSLHNHVSQFLTVCIYIFLCVCVYLYLYISISIYILLVLFLWRTLTNTPSIQHFHLSPSPVYLSNPSSSLTCIPTESPHRSLWLVEQ